MSLVDDVFEQLLNYHPDNGQAGSNLITVAQLHAVLNELSIETGQAPLRDENK